MDDQMFQSQTYGNLDLRGVREKALEFINKFPDFPYQLIIGTDSQPKNGSGVDFVIAIVIHRIGMGGVYFWKRIVESKSLVLRDRIYTEATLSLTCAQEVLKVFKKDPVCKTLEIHVDIGQNGETREMISEIVGMIRGSGFRVKTKPESYGASKVADRHT